MPPPPSDKSTPRHDKGGKKPWQRHWQRPPHKQGQPVARSWQKPGDTSDGPFRLFGMHAVEAALANPERKVLRLLLTENAENRLAAAVQARGLVPERVTPRELDRLLGPDTVHQGVLLETEELPETRLEALAEAARQGPPIILLDQVTDPHNVGAILRSAAVLGAAGVVMTRRHSPPLDGTVAKAASGALELVPVALVANLARSIALLKEHDVRVIGLDGEASQTLDEVGDLLGTAIVLGAEGKGLRQLTRESCDSLVAIATGAGLRSLNVSNAAAIALHLALIGRKRRPSAIA